MALDGALMQETPFDFEIVISEDCSTDSTRAIVDRYAALYPDQIRVRYSPRNLGAVKSFVLQAGPKLEVLARNDLGDPSRASAAIASSCKANSRWDHSKG